MLEKDRKKTKGIYNGKGKLGRREEEKMKARQRQEEGKRKTREILKGRKKDKENGQTGRSQTSKKVK